MRILHTSDWHLGLSSGPVSRLEEQRRFLSWLAQHIAGAEVDALVVAGDVFDGVQPSAEAQALYYSFLAELRSSGVRDVVVVGGNHDSHSRLEAPREILAAFDVYVVGGLPSHEGGLDALVVPLRRRGSEEVDAVCLAVPFVHEYRLGVRTTDLDPAAVAEAFEQRFTALYAGLADRAAELFPGRPMIATGHLVLGKAAPGDYLNEIHQVGFIGGLPVSVLDERLSYAALGHIHRAYPVVEDRAWYSGSPVPVSVSEAAVARKVLIVELDGPGQASITPVEVPRFRDLTELEGSPDEIISSVEGITSDAAMPPLLFLRALLEAPEPGLRERLEEALRGFPEEERPRVVEIREVFAGCAAEEPERSPPRLEEMSVGEVFALLCRAQGVGEEKAAALSGAFEELRSMAEEDFAALLEEAGGGPEAEA